MEAKEMTVSDLAREQIRNAERLFPLILEKQKKEKRKKQSYRYPEVLVSVRPEWLSYFKICLKTGKEITYYKRG